MTNSILTPAPDPLLAAALDGTPTGLVILDADRRVRLVTAAAAALAGLDDPQRLCGQPADALLAGWLALTPQSAADLGHALAGQGGETADLILKTSGPQGARTIAAGVRAAASLGWVLSLVDVTHARQTEDWLLEHASSDQATGLRNRANFLLMLQDRMSAGAAPVAVMLFGLQRLRLVTDGLGMGADDAVLRLVADRLRAHVRESDLLARLSADEFALVTARALGRTALTALAARLTTALAEPYVVDGEAVSLGVRAGVACGPDDGTTAADLVEHANLALHDTARRGAAAVRFFDPELMQTMRSRRAFEQDLRLALVREEFELHYQPQVDVRLNRVTGLEALIRWRSPQRGLVPPVEFIQLAERVGLINTIGDWVLRRACLDAARWPRGVTVAVNASPLQFETGHFARSVAEALAGAGLEPGRLEIEITESLLLRETGSVTATLAGLHAMGVRVVLDDFGTGYASLSQLSRFRFDKIKIDRSFVSPAVCSAENSAIVRSIAALGRSLSIPTTAEGVETPGQLEQTIADGCTLVQGYLFSRPVPVGEVDALLLRLAASEAPLGPLSAPARGPGTALIGGRAPAAAARLC